MGEEGREGGEGVCTTLQTKPGRKVNQRVYYCKGHFVVNDFASLKLKLGKSIK